MRSLKTITTELTARKTELTDAIAAKFPVGSKVLVQTKHGWEYAKVIWTPERSNGANPHVYVKRLRTGGEHKIDLSGMGTCTTIRTVEEMEGPAT